MENESTLMESLDKQVVLTSHRIRQECKLWGEFHLKSIMLEDITSCEYTRTSSPTILVLSIVLASFGFISACFGDYEMIRLGALIFLMGLVFIILYLLTNRKRLIISSPTCKITMKTKRMKDESIKEFIEKLEKAKNERYLKRKYNIE